MGDGVCGDFIKDGEQMQRTEKLQWKVCPTFHAETLKVFFLLYLLLYTVNNEQFMTSVLPRVVENTQKRQWGMHTVDSIVLNTLQVL